MKIKILDEAQADLREGAEFYERQNIGLGTYFLDTLFADIESLILYAGVHLKLNGYHRLLSKTFPFAVYYLIEGETSWRIKHSALLSDILSFLIPELICIE
jgi:hypothetical protein